MDTKCCPTGLGLGQTDLCKFSFPADAKHPQTTLNRVRPSANSFCRAPQTLCHFSISWRCHIICCPPLSTPWQCETINEISSCRASLGKTNQSATAAWERCKIAWHKSKSTSKFIEKYVKHAPHDVHAPNSLPISSPPCPCWATEAAAPNANCVKDFFSLSLHLLFAAKL